MSNALITLTQKLASRLDMGDGNGLIDTLKATAFRGQVSDAQMTALLLVANQYGLNPWTREIYAFPDKNNGIVPVVGVDGWSRIINENPHFDGIDFEQDDKQCTCVIYRKDRSHPIKVTEYIEECKRGTQPWQSHPKRMLRHKAMIQCARLAFGFVGIFDQDEAERIAERDITPAKSADTMVNKGKAAISEERFVRALTAIKEGTYSADALRRGCTLSEEQERALQTALAAPVETSTPKAEQTPMDDDNAAWVADMDAAQEGKP